MTYLCSWLYVKVLLQLGKLQGIKARCLEGGVTDRGGETMSSREIGESVFGVVEEARVTLEVSSRSRGGVYRS
jgi:hypothetical protein